MTLDGEPLLKGQSVFWPKKTPKSFKFHSGIVLDLNEDIKAVKLEITVGFKTLRQWFPAAALKRKIEDEKPAGN